MLVKDRWKQLMNKSPFDMTVIEYGELMIPMFLLLLFGIFGTITVQGLMFRIMGEMKYAGGILGMSAELTGLIGMLLVSFCVWLIKNSEMKE